MANKFRNEKQIKLGGVEVLLRPSFENIANLEDSLGFGLPTLSLRLSKMFQRQETPKLTDLAKIVFHCQAEKKYNLDEIWELCQEEGIESAKDILVFVSNVTAGNKAAPQLSEEEVKKN